TDISRARIKEHIRQQSTNQNKTAHLAIAAPPAVTGWVVVSVVLHKIVGTRLAFDTSLALLSYWVSTLRRARWASSQVCTRFETALFSVSHRPRTLSSTKTLQIRSVLVLLKLTRPHGFAGAFQVRCDAVIDVRWSVVDSVGNGRILVVMISHHFLSG